MALWYLLIRLAGTKVLGISTVEIFEGTIIGGTCSVISPGHKTTTQIDGTKKQ